MPPWLLDLQTTLEPAADDHELIDHLERHARRLVSSSASRERLELLEGLETLGLAERAEPEKLAAALDIALAAFTGAGPDLTEPEFRRLLEYAVVLGRSLQPLKAIERVATLPPDRNVPVRLRSMPGQGRRYLAQPARTGLRAGACPPMIPWYAAWPTGRSSSTSTGSRT